MSFTFNSNIPAADNNPSDDQPEMLQNNQTHVAIWNVDHISFNNNDAGKHKQVTFQGEYPAGSPTNPESVSYTDVQSGSAFTNSQMYFRNQDSPYLLNCVRAFGSVTTFPFNLDNSYNVASASGGVSSITVELSPNIVVGNDVTIIATISGFTTTTSSGVRWSFSNPNITFNPSPSQNWSPSVKLSFIVLQA